MVMSLGFLLKTLSLFVIVLQCSYLRRSCDRNISPYAGSTQTRSISRMRNILPSNRTNNDFNVTCTQTGGYSVAVSVQGLKT